MVTSDRIDEWIDVRIGRILDVSADLLGATGYDGFQLREVARQARVSMTTIYDAFPSREELVVASLDHWMREHIYAWLPSPLPGEPLRDTLLRLFHQLIIPWRSNPTLLNVMLQAALLPEGRTLWTTGEEIIRAKDYFTGYPPELVQDIQTVLTYVTHGLVSGLAVGRISGSEVLRIYERTVRRLTSDVGPPAAAGDARRDRA